MNVPNSLWGKIIQTIQKSYPRGEKKKKISETPMVQERRIFVKSLALTVAGR